MQQIAALLATQKSERIDGAEMGKPSIGPNNNINESKMKSNINSAHIYRYFSPTQSELYTWCDWNRVHTSSHYRIANSHVKFCTHRALMSPV